MNPKISFLKNNHIHLVEFDINDDTAFIDKRMLYEKILIDLFKGQSIFLVTLNPTKDAICFDQKCSQAKKIGKNVIVESFMTNASASFLSETIDTLEFETGDLAIGLDLKRDKGFGEYICSFIQHVKMGKNFERSSFNFCFTMDDGYKLCLVNLEINGLHNIKTP